MVSEYQGVSGQDGQPWCHGGPGGLHGFTRAQLLTDQELHIFAQEYISGAVSIMSLELRIEQDKKKHTLTI